MLRSRRQRPRVEPADLAFRDRERQLVGLLPRSARTRRAARRSRPGRSDCSGRYSWCARAAFETSRKQLFDARRRKGRFRAAPASRSLPGRRLRTEGGGHVPKIFISLTCATSLSPRPLTHSSTDSSFAPPPFLRRDPAHSVRRFERRNDSLQAAQESGIPRAPRDRRRRRTARVHCP